MSRVKVGSVQLAKTQMISKAYFARLKVLAVYQERLGDMTEQDSYDEGGYTLDGYKETFQRIYGFYDPDFLVYVVKFETI
jgi:hypothetical protein